MVFPNTCSEKVVSSVFALGAVGVGLYAIIVYFLEGALNLMPLGATVHPEMQRAFPTERAAILTHAFSAGAALIIGPFQVIPYFRARSVVVHRWMGRLYTICAVTGSVTAFIVAFKAQGGLPGQIGFHILAVLALGTTIGGVLSIFFFKNIFWHERLMQHSVGLMYSAATLRLYLPLVLIRPDKFQIGYAVIAWLCWVPNIMVVELIRCYYQKKKMAEVEAAKDSLNVEEGALPNEELGNPKHEEPLDRLGAE